MRFAAYGDQAVLIDTERPLTVRDALSELGDPAIRAIVPAARTVLVEFTGPRPDVSALLDRLDLSERAPASGDVLELPVYYDGADLDGVAAELGMSRAELIRRHANAEYRVQFCGFSPGFGYLTGLDERLRLPRLASPRTSVPAGSVAIADEFTGVYPRSSPGGWRLLGHTNADLFDLDRKPPALLTPGRRVKFVPQPERSGGRDQRSREEQQQ